MPGKNTKFREDRPAGGSEVTGTRGTYEQGTAYAKMLKEQEQQHLKDMEEIYKQLDDNRGRMNKK